MASRIRWLGVVAIVASVGCSPALPSPSATAAVPSPAVDGSSPTPTDSPGRPRSVEPRRSTTTMAGS